ncbi:conserved Plasmodium protein, unknown function [Plasmodium ovale curtisi]|uniref:Uncharacterized protein n=2 Tax=Plasmodium ovale TaxID=36330 RepID=A0A1A8VV44_PLAOA|nr:conserved Plasmodium protein, unknown function [Plasmodium ovale curtisi]
MLEICKNGENKAFNHQLSLFLMVKSLHKTAALVRAGNIQDRIETRSYVSLYSLFPSALHFLNYFLTMRTILFNGPYIPEIDAGYNVQANGVSINFLKNPFCFRDNMTGNPNYNYNKIMVAHANRENIKRLDDITAKSLVELSKYIYEGETYARVEVPHMNAHTPKDECVYEEELSDMARKPKSLKKCNRI